MREKEQMGREGLCGRPEKLNPKGKRKTYGFLGREAKDHFSSIGYDELE